MLPATYFTWGWTKQIYLLWKISSLLFYFWFIWISVAWACPALPRVSYAVYIRQRTYNIQNVLICGLPWPVIIFLQWSDRHSINMFCCLSHTKALTHYSPRRILTSVDSRCLHWQIPAAFWMGTVYGYVCVECWIDQRKTKAEALVTFGQALT